MSCTHVHGRDDRPSTPAQMEVHNGNGSAMQPLLIVIGAVVLSSAVTLSAQAGAPSARVGEYAEDLRRAAARLADRTSQDLLDSRANAAGDIQDALRAQQLHATATLLVDMVRSRRPARELREVVTSLVDLLGRAPASSRSSVLWRNVQDAAADVDRELGGFRGGPAPPPERPIIGRVAWRGWVDDRVHLVIRGQSVEVRTVSGSPRADGIATFTSPLPERVVEVGVEKNRGRGTVTVLQQPSRVNEYTTVVEVSDPNGGAQEYRLDIFWR